jgi:aspartate ammonia-lyase
MMPLIAYNLLFSIEILSSAVNAFTVKCIKGIRPDIKRCREFAELSSAVATALNPIIGYSSAAEVSKEAYRTGKTVLQIVVEKGILRKKVAERLLDPLFLTRRTK